jgi:tetratricopeptide (TPR) repeat protein
LPLLSFDYLNALAIAFLSGKLLFVSQIRPTRRGRGFSWLLNVWARRGAPAGLIVLSTILFIGLMLRSAPAIFPANHQPLESFGALAAASLPAGGGLVLSEDATKLAIFQAALAHQRDRSGVQVVDLYLLPYPEYRAALERQQSRGWLTPPTAHALNSSELLGLLVKLAGTNRIFFLQPSPGHYFFEHFYPEPHAALTELKPYSGDQVRPPPLAPAAFAAGEEFWDEAWAKQLQPVSQGGARLAGSKTMEAIFRRVLLSPLPDRQHVLLGWWYSYSLTSWGVELQRGGRLPAAQKRFEQALALSPRNWSAAMDLQCNTNLQAGKILDLAGMTAAADQLGDFKNFARVMCRCGPFDDPGLCFLFGHACQQFGWPRQALQQLERANALAPAALPTALALAEFYSRYRMADPVFEIIQRVRANRFTSTNQLADVELELSLLEAKAWVYKTNLPNARRILQSILQQRPNDTPAANLVFQTYQAIGDLTNALTVVTSQLALAPDNPAALNNQAAILIQLNRAGDAVSILNHALAITNSPAIRLNRAIAYLQSGNLAASEADYHQLENSSSNIFQIHYGLAEIARQRHDTNLALHYFASCLSHATPGTALWETARKYRDELKNPTGEVGDASPSPRLAEPNGERAGVR